MWILQWNIPLLIFLFRKIHYFLSHRHRQSISLLFPHNSMNHHFVVSLIKYLNTRQTLFTIFLKQLVILQSYDLILPMLARLYRFWVNFPNLVLNPIHHISFVLIVCLFLCFACVKWCNYDVIYMITPYKLCKLMI